MTPTRPKRKRYLGMTGSQIGILVAMGVLVVTVFGIGLALILGNSSQSSTFAPLTSEQQKATISSAAAATIAAMPAGAILPFPTFTPEVQFPPTWTPTPVRTVRPKSTPTKIVVDSRCQEFSMWLNQTRDNIDAARVLNQKVLAIDSSDSQSMIDVSNGYLLLSTKQGQIRTTSVTAKMNKDLVASFDAYSLGWWDAGLGAISNSKRLVDLATQNISQAVSLLAAVSKDIDKMKSSCGIR